MSFKFAPLLFVAVVLNAAGATIDFTPLVEEYTNEGMVFHKVTFKADNGTVTFIPPAGWTIRGGVGGAQLAPKDKTFADAAIQARPLSDLQSFDEAGLRTLEEEVLKEVPPGSQSVQLVKRQENPIVLGPNRSFEFLIAYQVIGHAFQRSVIFVQTPEAQLIFRLSAAKADFEPLEQAFRTSITSWNWVHTKTAESAARDTAAPSVPATPQPN